mmetsp:Transcript_68790/g.119461  ORF Transcript_68790/g.119461 Transcript_68790/m.119461 type:complete len:102 (-) Transcript_68790:88-393(-)
MSAAFAAKASPSKPGDVITVSGASFVRVDNLARIEAYTSPGQKLIVMHDIPGHGGYFMVPDGNLLCGLVQWVLAADGSVHAHYWMEKGEHDMLISKAAGHG